MWKYIIIGLAVYYIIVLSVMRRYTVFKENTRPKDEPGHETEFVGRTTFRMRQMTTTKDNERQLSEPQSNTDTFVTIDPDSTSADDYLLEIERTVEIEYEPEKDADFDDYEEETGQPVVRAQGISFEEMAQAVDVLKADDTTEAEEREALHTISIMGQSSLYEKMVAQIDGGRQKVTELFRKYDAVTDPVEPAEQDAGMADFNMDDFL
mgnify:CR=1 FL=1